MHYFLDAQPQHVHASLMSDNYSSFEVGGVVLKDWIGGAVTDPGSLVDRVEEGTLVMAFPGVLPFACPVDP